MRDRTRKQFIPGKYSGSAITRPANALFHDSDIFNTAKVNNERTWTTGDVCEFFIQPAGQDDYFEFHVTPEGITLQLHLPPVSRMGSLVTCSRFCSLP